MEKDSLALVTTDEKGFAVGPAASWTLSEDKVSSNDMSVRLYMHTYTYTRAWLARR